MIVREPFQLMVSFIDRTWMYTNGLIVAHITKAFTISNQQFRIKTPSNHRACDHVVVTISIRALRYIEEQPATIRKSCSKQSALLLSNLWKTYLLSVVRSVSVSGKKPASTMLTTSCPFKSSMFDRVCWLKKFFLQN